MNLQVGVKAIIKNNQGKFLFLRRTQSVSTDSGDRSWDIAGGRINFEESLIEGLKREIREEIGVEIHTEPKIIAAQDIFVQGKEIHIVRLTYLLKEDVEDIHLSHEHDAYQWLSTDELNTINIEPYLKEALVTVL
ncbi:MAG: NUDIX domain-containing protein [Candidatus Microsaccharimonas sp.]